MTAPRPEIQRLEFYVEDDGDRDPWAVPHNDPTGDYVRHSDHLRAVTLAEIEVLEEMPVATVETEDGKVHLAVEHMQWVWRKITALRKELEE